MKTVSLDLTIVETKTHYDGHTTLEVFGRTPGGKSLKVKIKMGFTTPGYIARALSEAIDSREKEIAEMRSLLPRQP